jgi:hypothetical protein
LSPLRITGISPQGENTREINLFFDKAYEDGYYELPISQSRTSARYIDNGNYYFSSPVSAILYLTVKDNRTHYSGKFDKVGFEVDEVFGPKKCIISASFDVKISGQ